MRPGHIQQLGGPLALLPQRLTFAGVAPRQQQGAGGALTEPPGEQGRGAHRVRHLGDDGGGVRTGRAGTAGEQFHPGRVLGVRQAQDDPVVPGDRHGVDPRPPRERRTDRQRPRRVHRPAPGGVHDHAPVADLVMETFDEQCLLVRDDLCRLPLLRVEHVQVGPGVLVEEGRRPQVTVATGPPRPPRCADHRCKFRRPALGVPHPERQASGVPGRRGDDDLVTGDLIDPPGGRAEREHVPDPGLVDHLLVEFTDAASSGVVPVGGQVHAEQSAVRYGSAAGHGDTPGPGTGDERAGGGVVDHAGTQLREVGRGVPAADQFDDAVEGLPRQGGVGVGAAHGAEPLLHVHRVTTGRFGLGGAGDGLLGEHVEGVGDHVQRFQVTGEHPVDDDGRGLGVLPVQGVDGGAGDRADGVPGASCPLHRRGHARWRTDLHDVVDQTHVDAEFQ